MITRKIKAMFQFIEFLHSNIENFKQYDEIINKLYLLDEERNKLNPRRNFTDKLKYDEVQSEIEDKFKVIQENIISPIESKATELIICSFQNEPLYNWNGIESDIHHLKENFSNDDIPEILKHKSKYIEFRTETNCTYFQNLFFSYLDETLKELFDFFKNSNENEFEAFEQKTVQVNSISEMVEKLQKGNNRFSLSISFWNASKVEQQNIAEILPPSQIKPNPEQQAPSIKPIFKPEAISTILDLLKDFFSPEHQTQLKQILETGNNASEQLIFLDTGNRLADAFKQLYDIDIITGCEKKELESWICNNFRYRFRQNIKSFTPHYLNNIISTKKDLCQNPILNTKKDLATGKVLISKA